MRSVRVRTPAKVNLFLRVLGPRPDGYHNIETLFQAIDLHDEIIISETSGPSRIEVPGHPALETEDNLAMRSLRRLEKETGRQLPVNIRLTKRIPTAGGLGGGSSDGAGALLGIRALFDLDLAEDDLRRAAVELGADVPFFLMGGTAVGEGMGERLTSVTLTTDYRLVLVNPGFPVSTAAIFRELTGNLTRKPRQGTLWKLLRESRKPLDLLENDLQSVAEGLHPEIGEIRGALEQAGVTKALMTGSGPTVFGIAEPDMEHPERIGEKLPEKWSIVATGPLNQGVTVD